MMMMMINYLQAALLLVSHITRASPISADLTKLFSGEQDGSVAVERTKRSGGYPKFPVMELASCGARDVYYQPQRSGDQRHPTPKIVGGDVAPYGAYPWQVEIQILMPEKGGFKHHCGGAVVAERLVVTAAHCLQNVRPSQLRLLVGDYDLEQADHYEQSFTVEKLHVHPDFRRDGPYSNDIALIKVKAQNAHGISFNSYVQPICLPESHTSYPVGTWCTVTGWGAQKPDDLESLSRVLRAASVPLLDIDTCRQDEVYGGRRQSILDSMVCAGLLQGGVDACGGDSGGPLACEIKGRFVLAGVVSWGDGCAKKNRPGVYTRVSHYTDWIESSKQTLMTATG